VDVKNPRKGFQLLYYYIYNVIWQVMVAALKFFQSSDEPGKESDDSDSDVSGPLV
jgi:hypothetical protein